MGESFVIMIGMIDLGVQIVMAFAGMLVAFFDSVTELPNCLGDSCERSGSYRCWLDCRCSGHERPHSVTIYWGFKGVTESVKSGETGEIPNRHRDARSIGVH